MPPSFRSDLYRQTYGRYRSHQIPQDHMAPGALVTEKPFLYEIPLSRDLPASIGDIQHEKRFEYSLWTWSERLATLLYYTLGIQRLEIGTPRPLHRAIPSPRCLVSSEVFLCLGKESPLQEVGVARYHPIRHHLEVRRKKGDWKALEAALGFSLQQAEAVLVISAEFWRIAFMYGDFAYHLATLEAGHTRGQMVQIARQLGWEPTWHDLFIDQIVIDWLGMDQEAENPLTIMILWSQKPECVPIQSGDKPSFPSYFYPSMWADKLKQCPSLLRLAQRTRIHSLNFPLLHEQMQLEIEEERAAILLQPECGRWKRTDWGELFLYRSSGNDTTGLMTEWAPLHYSDFSLMLSTFLKWTKEHPELFKGIRFYLWLQRVSGIKPGIYILNEEGKLVSHRDQPIRELQELSTYSYQMTNQRSIPVSIFITADYIQTCNHYGPRGYPILQMRVGHVSQYLSLLASAMGWILRPVKSFDEYLVEEELGCISPTETAVYQLLIGKNRNPFLNLDMSL